MNHELEFDFSPAPAPKPEPGPAEVTAPAAEPAKAVPRRAVREPAPARNADVAPTTRKAPRTAPTLNADETPAEPAKEPERDVYTPGRLNREARALLERGLPSLWLEGE